MSAGITQEKAKRFKFWASDTLDESESKNLFQKIETLQKLKSLPVFLTEIKDILTKNISVSAEQGEKKTTALHLVASMNFSKNSDFCLALATQQSAENTENLESFTSIDSDTQNHHLLKQLVKHKTAKLNQQDSEGRTPLHIAAEANNLENIDILIKNGADPFIKNAKGKTAFELATDRHCQQYLKIAQNYQQLKNILKSRYSLGIMGTFFLTFLTLEILKEAKPSVVVDMLGDKALFGLDAWQMTVIGILFLIPIVMLIAKTYTHHKQNKVIEENTAQLNAAALGT